MDFFVSNIDLCGSFSCFVAFETFSKEIMLVLVQTFQRCWTHEMWLIIIYSYVHVKTKDVQVNISVSEKKFLHLDFTPALVFWESGVTFFCRWYIGFVIFFRLDFLCCAYIFFCKRLWFSVGWDKHFKVTRGYVLSFGFFERTVKLWCGIDVLFGKKRRFEKWTCDVARELWTVKWIVLLFFFLTCGL